MGWVLIVLLQLAMACAGYQAAKRSGMWSWPRFAFILGFAGLECAILIAPIYFIHNVHNRYFIPAYVAAWVIALANLAGLILLVRRWKPRSPRGSA